jgi:putative transposase
MPRANRRSLLPGYPLHVLQRGHNKARVFLEDADHGLFLGLLQEYSKKHACAIHAYVLMSNHIHLLMSPPDIPSLSKLMRDVNQVYGQHFNRKNDRCGSLWQGRFKASLVDSAEYFLTCQRYHELNPVRAGMVVDPARYALSSYRTNAEGLPSTFVTPHRRYLALGATDDTRRKAYRALFGAPIREEELSRIRNAVQRERPIGDDAFVARIDAELAKAEPVPYPAPVPVPYQVPVLPVPVLG